MTKARDLANASTALSAVSATELGYLDGVTSAVQTQMDAKLASSTAATTYVANALADAKGDIFVASADNTVTRLPVGSTGDTIVADSSTSTGLRYTANFAAGKNKIINGDFGIWQRGTSFTATGYTADRFRTVIQNSTTISRQTFTPGTAPVSGYEGQYFLRLARTTSATGDFLTQKIEDVRTFAGQTITVSFWAKANTGVALTSLYIEQDFGAGGSTAAATFMTAPTLTTSWARYSATVAVPSISGKTVGTSSFLDLIWAFGSGMGNCTVDIWGVQVEAGSVATAFQTATGTIQGELAACQRYYWRYTAATATGSYMPFGMGHAVDANNARFMFQYPVPARGNPTLTFTAASTFQKSYGTSFTSIGTAETGRNSASVDVIKTGEFAANQAVLVTAAGNQTAYIEMSAEL